MNSANIIFSIVLIFLFISCDRSGKKIHLHETEQAKYINQGNSIMQQSFQALSAELSSALQEGGIRYAAGYCHLNASPLIDSLSILQNAKISRTSMKFRNPTNRPDRLDIIVLEQYRIQLADSITLQPHLEIEGENIVFYAPIVIKNPMCLLCHGEPGKTMDPEDYNFIKSRYPEDMATGYQLGDLRGVWKIEFELNDD